MFSSRTGWDLTPNALHRVLDEKRANGEQILDLTESNPTRCGFPYDASLLRNLSSEQSLLYEPDPHGLLTARTGIAGYYRDRGHAVDPSNVFITASTSEAYSHLFRLLCNVGDNVLIPKPSYPLFEYLCTLNDVEARHYRLRYSGEWQIDLGSLADSIDESTRAILLVHPNNPTGSLIKQGERKEILEVAKKRRVALIVDEVFSEFALTESQNRYRSFAGEHDALVFALNGISKLLGLPQMKLAWIVVTGEPALVQDANRRLEMICDTYLSAGTPVQHALPDLLAYGRRVTDQIQQRVKTNYQSLRTMVAGSPVSVLEADAGWNAIVQLPRVLSDDGWALRALQEHHVLVHPGHYFEIEQEACIVVSLLPDSSAFSSGTGKTLSLVQSATGQ